MANSQENLKVQSFLKAALECSIYLAPTEPGLSYDELLEVGSRAALQQGEIADGIRYVTPIYMGGRPDTRLLPNANDMVLWGLFVRPEVPDFRNPQAFDFVFAQLGESARAYGAGNVRLERSVIVERGAADQLPRVDIEAAITILILTETLQERDGIISFRPGREGFAGAGVQMKQAGRAPTVRNEPRERAYPIVKDVIERRTDGRPKSAEPLEAFADELGKLGYGVFRMWWTQTVAEFRQASTQTAPMTATVLAAALVEGALTFVVQHARTINLGVMGSKTFEGSSTSWRIDHLVSSAAGGGEAAILDNPMRQRAEMLVRSRQRIHAGRMLSDFPGGPPDLRPDEARDSKMTAEQVVRRIVDWLQRYPASDAQSAK